MLIKDSPPAPQVSKEKKGTLKQQKVAGAGVEDFIMWIPPISRHSLDLEEEEEEDEMSGFIHNFAARKRKRDAILEQGADAPSEVVRGSGQPCLDEGSEVQAIVISVSLEMGLNDQLALENVTLVESREASLVPVAI